MPFQMIRVISSPSKSTTGLTTRILSRSEQKIREILEILRLRVNPTEMPGMRATHFSEIFRGPAKRIQ
uniref:Uncharacterized protein n=1 Tax=Romanomermis culicivorax TaxID=13658 RepID=A0A915KY04_ROMCU